MDLFRPGADVQKGRERNNNTNVNHLQMSLKRYELSVPSFRSFTDLRFIKVSPKGDQKPLLPWRVSWLRLSGDYTPRRWRVHMEDTSFLTRDKISAGSQVSEESSFLRVWTRPQRNTGCSSVDKQTGRRARLRYSYDSFFFFCSCCCVLCYALTLPRQTAPHSAFPPPASWGFLPVFKSSVGVRLHWLITNKHLRFPLVAEDFLLLYWELNWKR